MDTLCTYFDRAYLPRGLALHESLLRHWRDFELFVLCLDEETERVLTRLDLPRVRLVPLAELERFDPALAATRDARSRIGYYFTCTPCFTLYVLGLARTRRVYYVDADLYFFSPPEPLLDEHDRGSVYVHEQWPDRPGYQPQYGRFNVGLVGFQRDRQGRECLELWRSRCLESCEAGFHAGGFGDQKYLDEWPTRFDRVVVARHRGVGVAPWNLADHQVSVSADGSHPLVDGVPVVFFHFSGLQAVIPGLFRAGFLEQLSSGARVGLYRPYLRALTAKARLLRRLGERRTPPLGRMRKASAALPSLRRLLSNVKQGLRRRSLLLSLGRLVL